MGDGARFLTRLREGPPIVLDGATGTELARRGVDISGPLWSARAIREAPEMLATIHREYARAGAELHTAATFRTGPRTLARAGLVREAAQLVAHAVDIARRAVAEAAEGPTWIAGSLAPVGDCYRPDLVPDDATLRDAHTNHAEMLLDAGVDLILIETMNTVREAVAAAAAARATGLPVLVSFVVGGDGKLLSGEDIMTAVERMAPSEPDMILVNCASGAAVTHAAETLRRAWRGPWGAYANAGTGDPRHGWGALVDANTYCGYARAWLAGGARLVGGCCGTGPEHIAAVAGLVREERTVRRA